MYALVLRSRLPAWIAPLVTIVLFALLTPPALGQEPPAFTAGPVLEGPVAVGGELRITAAWSGAPAPAQLYEWDRCDASGLFCDVVEDACAATYDLNNDDVGDRLRAHVQLFNAAGTTGAFTPLSDLLVGGPAGDDGTHDGGRHRDDRGGSSNDFASEGDNGRRNRAPAHAVDTRKGPGKPGKGGSPKSSCAPVVPPAAPVPAAAPPAVVPIGAASPRRAYLQPFPTVRIAGYTVAGGARITLVSLRGAPSAVVRATCTGAGCPRRTLSPSHPPARLRALERFYPAGTLLQIRVTARATIGKYTSLRILARSPPRRTDRCLMPGRWAPVRCPAPG